jgi:hypothetical protein
MAGSTAEMIICQNFEALFLRIMYCTCKLYVFVCACVFTSSQRMSVEIKAPMRSGTVLVLLFSFCGPEIQGRLCARVHLFLQLFVVVVRITQDSLK